MYTLQTDSSGALSISATDYADFPPEGRASVDDEQHEGQQLDESNDVPTHFPTQRAVPPPDADELVPVDLLVVATRHVPHPASRPFLTPKSQTEAR